MSKEVIAILSGLLNERGEIKTAYKPKKKVQPRKELHPVNEADLNLK